MNRIIYFSSNYDKETGKLVTPYIVCGQSGQADYKDLVGINARLNNRDKAYSYIIKNMKMREKRIIMISILQIPKIIVFVN